MFYTTDGLVAAAKLSEFFPVSQNTFTDPDDIITFFNQEIETKLVPAMMSVRQDYFLTYKLVSLVANVNHYAIPERALGNGFKDLRWVNDINDLTNSYPLSKGQYGNTNAGFSLMGDEIVLTSTPKSVNSNQALQFVYHERPNKLVPVANCAKITGISSVGGTTTFTVDTDLTASLSVGSLIDLQSAVSPFKLWTRDAVITAITSTTIAVATSQVQDESLTVTPKVNDYISLAQTSCIPMFPSEVHPIIAEMGCYRAMKACGAVQKLQIVASNIKDMMSGVFKLIENRVESEVDVVYDRSGFLGAIGYSGFARTTF